MATFEYDDSDYQQSKRILNLPNPASAREPMLAQVPQCRVYNNAAIATTTGVTVLTFNSERYDVDAMHSTTTNTSRITFNTAGCYSVSACVAWTSSSNGERRYTAIRLNGSIIIVAQNTPPYAPAATSIINNVTTEYRFAVNDYVEVIVQSLTDGPSGLTVLSTGNYSPEFAATFRSI